MDINFLPDPSLNSLPTLIASLEELRFVPGGVDERITWAHEAGFGGVELLATGEPESGVHVPSVDAGDRAQLRDILQNRRLVVQAPHQQTWDVTLVSPSSAIRRASLTEIWAVCRFAGIVGVKASAPPVVLVRTGTPPPGMGTVRVLNTLRESLGLLDRMASEHGVRIGLLNRDVWESPDEWEMLASDLPHIGLAFDIPHALDQSMAFSDAAALLRRFAGRFVYVRAEAGSRDESRAVLADTLKETSYAGSVCLTLSPARHDDADAFQAQTGENCRDWNRALQNKP